MSQPAVSRSTGSLNRLTEIQAEGFEFIHQPDAVVGMKEAMHGSSNHFTDLIDLCQRFLGLCGDFIDRAKRAC